MSAPRPWRVHVLTLFPDMLPGPLGHSLAGRALADGIWALETVDIRGFARDKHGSVDDTPFGGGPGMVMRADVVAAAVDSVLAEDAAAGAEAVGKRGLICLTARGAPLNQRRVRELACLAGVGVLCGRFEGIDQRVIEARGFEEVSVGEIVLSGGEPAAISLIDACVRLLPGVVGDPEALVEESFEGGLLEYPQYTRPRVWEGREVPEVLLSGNHGEIAAWRRSMAAAATRERRPDMWRRHRRPPGGGTD